MAAWTTSSRLARWNRVTEDAIPPIVSFRLEPVSASEMGKTFIAFSASAESATTCEARRSQASPSCHRLGGRVAEIAPPVGGGAGLRRADVGTSPPYDGPTASRQAQVEVGQGAPPGARQRMYDRP